MLKLIYLRYKEVINYLVIGGLTTLINLVCYYVLVLTVLNPEIAIQLQIANVFSWVVAVTFAYFTNRKFVFESKNANKIREAISFYAARVATLFIEMLIMFLLVTQWDANDKVAKVITQVVVTVVNYVFSKFFVFKLH